MAAATKECSNLAHIHRFAGTKTHFVFQISCLIHENRTFNPFYNPELIDNSIQIIWFCIIKIKCFFINNTDNTSSVHKHNTLKKRTAQKLVLRICFFIKCFFDNRRKIKPVFDKLCRNPQRLGRCIGILEYACIMHNSYVNRFCYIFVQIFFFHQIIYKFRC